MKQDPHPTLVKVEAEESLVRQSEVTLYGVTPQTIGAVAQNHQGHSSLDLRIGSNVLNLLLNSPHDPSKGNYLDTTNLDVIEKLIAVLIELASKIEQAITPRKYPPITTDNPGLKEYAKWLSTIQNDSITVDSQGGRK